MNRREANQQKRIGNGVENGKLNSQQATNLEKRETSVQNREKKDMAEHNGHLTKAEQKGINRQQNRISKSIYKDKHLTSNPANRPRTKREDSRRLSCGFSFFTGRHTVSDRYFFSERMYFTTVADLILGEFVIIRLASCSCLC